MNTATKNAAAQSRKRMVFVLFMSLYGLALLFTELIPKSQIGLVEFSVEYFLFIPPRSQCYLIRCPLRWRLLSS